MANLNKVMLIGRLTRDPEVRTFNNGGKVAKFGFAVNNRKKNQQTGQWEDDPVFLDCEIFNRGEYGKKADVFEQYVTKGKQLFLDGHLVLQSWNGPDGAKRNKLIVVVDDFQFLEGKQDGSGGGGMSSGGVKSGGAPMPRNRAADEEMGEIPTFTEEGKADDIPF